MRRFARILPLTCLCLLSALPASAQDVLGVYFDAAGTTTAAVTTTPYEAVDLWLILRDGSRPAGVSSWECRVEAVTAGPAPLVSWTLAGSALNLATAPSFQVGLGAPLPAAPLVVLATASVLVPDPAQEVAFALHPFDPPSLQEPEGWGYPVYAPVYGTPPDNALTALAWPGGCEAEPVARINDDGQEPAWSLSGLPAALAFGELREGESGELAFFLRNDSAVAAVSGAIAITGAGFTVRHDGGYFTADPSDFRLEPGRLLNGSVRFTPGAGGAYAGELRVETCGQTLTAPLSGSVPSVSCLAGPASLDFGQVILGRTAVLPVVVVNDGEATLQVAPTAVCADFDFAQLPPGFPGPLAAGDSVTFEVTFQPSALGPLGCSLSFGELACGQIALHGEGVEAPPSCALSTTALDFGTVAVGQQRNLTVTITNAGGGVLSGEAVLAEPAGDFMITSGGGAYALSAGQSRLVTVGFLPTEVGARGGLLLTGCGEVTLAGSGRDPATSYTVPGQLGFGQVVVNATRTLPMLIVNTGETTLSGDLQCSGEGFALTGGGPFTLLPQRSLAREVVFAPPATGIFSGLIATGLPGGETVLLVGQGVVAYPWQLDTVGLYFDPEWASVYSPPLATPGSLAAYLALKVPTAAGDITGWRLCLEIVGTALITDWDFGPGAVNVGSGDCPVVLLASPAPAGGDLLLATVEVLVLDDFFSEVRLSDAAGTPAYFFAPDDREQAVRGAISAEVVAWIGAVPVPADAPPPATRLLANYPNPFNPSTTLPFTLERSGPVRLAVHDLAGRLVKVLADESLPAGPHERVWDGRDAAGRRVPSGVYYGRLESGGGVEMRKMMLVK